MSNDGSQRHSPNTNLPFQTPLGRSPDRKAGGSIPSGRTNFEYESDLLTTCQDPVTAAVCSSLQQFRELFPMASTTWCHTCPSAVRPPLG